MKILLTHTNPVRPIQAIKGIRAITGCSLREAKVINDDLNAGVVTAVQLSVSHEEAVGLLADHGLGGIVTTPDSSHDPSPHDSSPTVRTVLSRMPRHLTVGEVLDVLEAAGS